MAISRIIRNEAVQYNHLRISLIKDFMVNVVIKLNQIGADKGDNGGIGKVLKFEYISKRKRLVGTTIIFLFYRIFM